jgi:chitin synthase
MESFFGFISVLPGAFSAYRWAAIRGTPLKSYFLAEERSLRDLGPYMANLLLAEDRILCLEVVTRPTRAWTLRWVPNAVASTDVPDTLRELTQQRRRWLNGSFFNILYVLQHWRKILRSRHPWWRKLLLVLQYGFVLTTTIISWFAVASLYLSFQVIFEAVLAVTDFGSNEFGFGFSTIYALLVLSLVIVGLAGDIRHTETFYRFVATVFGFITLMGFAAGVFLFTTFSTSADGSIETHEASSHRAA